MIFNKYQSTLLNSWTLISIADSSTSVEIHAYPVYGVDIPEMQTLGSWRRGGRGGGVEVLDI